MLSLLRDGPLDMVTAARVTGITAAYRTGHRSGNAVLTGLVALLFGNRVTDMLSGYRVFSRRFVKSFPALSTGFETETEFTVHALELAMPVGEIQAAYKDRPAGSVSKLRTYTDGWRILRTIVLLVKEERPFQFFARGGRLPRAGRGPAGPPRDRGVHAHRAGPAPAHRGARHGADGLAFLSSTCGFILDSVARGRKEAKRMAYLSVPAIGADRSP